MTGPVRNGKEGAAPRREKIRIPYPVIVEGRYDSLRVDSVIDAPVIVTTEGFGIFRDTEKQALIRALAKKTPVVILTDPDGAGGVIRSKICGMIPPDRQIRLYVPRVEGMEKRKKAPSAEGVLGVEGTDRQTLRDLFSRLAEGCGTDAYGRGDGQGGERPSGAGAAAERPARKITAADLMADGLTGLPGSAEARDRLGAKFGLPPGMSAGAFRRALGILLTYEEYRTAVTGSGAADSGGDGETAAER